LENANHLQWSPANSKKIENSKHTRAATITDSRQQKKLLLTKIMAVELQELNHHYYNDFDHRPDHPLHHYQTQTMD